MLPARGRWPHPYYDVPDAYVEVPFTDAQGTERRVRVRHKELGEGPTLVLMHAPGYPFLRGRALSALLGAPVLGAGLASLVARVSTVEQIVSFGAVKG